MTDEQLEAAARKLCELGGVDPNEKRVLGTALDNAKREVLSFYRIAQALDSVIGNGELP